MCSCQTKMRLAIHSGLGWMDTGRMAMDGRMNATTSTVKGFNKSRHTTHTFHINQSQQHDNKRIRVYILRCKSKSSTYLLMGGFFFSLKYAHLVCHWTTECVCVWLGLKYLRTYISTTNSLMCFCEAQIYEFYTCDIQHYTRLIDVYLWFYFQLLSWS